MPHLPHPAPWRSPDAVAQFLGAARGEIPLAIEQVSTLLELVRAARGEKLTHFLDLGGGNGVLSAALLDEYPRACGWVIETPGDEPAGARQQLQEHPGRVVFASVDLETPGWEETICAGGPFDAIVSASAIHHLPDDRKREVYEELFGLLEPGGLFINIEHVASATRWTESVWDDYLIDAIFGEAIHAAPDRTRAEVAREYYARAVPGAARLAPLEVQCDWLREIGFEHVECYLKVQELAVFGGQRGEAEVIGDR
jgi:SAM-dependent methyltransferase